MRKKLLLFIVMMVLLTISGCSIKSGSNSQKPTSNSISTDTSNITKDSVSENVTPTINDDIQQISSAGTAITGDSEATDVTPKVTAEIVYEKNTPLNIDVVNESNIFFAKYDINIYIDDRKVGSVKNGGRFADQVMVANGNHKIKFTDSTYESTYTEQSFDLNGEVTLKYSLKAHEESIEIKSASILDGKEDNEIIIPELCGVMLNEARKELKALGAQNITTTVNSNEFIVDEKNWIVFNQSVASGTKMDRYDQITLVCGRIKDFVETYMFKNTLPEIISLGSRYGFTIEFVDDITGDKVYINTGDESISDWSVVSYNAPYNNTKNITYNISYIGSAVVPSVVGMDADKAREALKKAYFTNIELINEDNTPIKKENDWWVSAQSIEAGTEVKTNELIQLTVVKRMIDDSSDDSVYYSTNDNSTVKKGNKGVYAYASTGGSYKNYYIIDFDKGYVYFFSEGNGDSTCDKVKIDSGDLNSVVIITYHDSDGSKWSYGLHFKWKNQPTNLIVQDQNGFEYSYSCTDLDYALKVRDTKK